MTDKAEAGRIAVGDRPGYENEGFDIGLFEPHLLQVQKNHRQSLETLNRRGGFTWCEAVAIIEDREWHKMNDAENVFRQAVRQHLNGE